MATEKTHRVFCIGRTQVDEEEVRRWLDFLSAENFELPQEEAVSNPALLIALAAKRCYMAYEPGLNPNVTKVRKDYAEYFDNILASGHGSVLEHSVFNFAIENVSRVFTGEMNRHRAGWAISEGSQRFIRFGKNIPYVLPQSIQGPDVLDGQTVSILGGESGEKLLQEGQILLDTVDAKRQATRAVFRHAFLSQERYYRVLEEIWKDELHPKSPFADKKKITSLMRRIVGMGVATGGVWSGNVRALRHVLTMRCSAAAEEEICLVFSEVAALLAAKEPLLFGDFYQDEAGYWRPKYVKV